MPRAKSTAVARVLLPLLLCAGLSLQYSCGATGMAPQLDSRTAPSGAALLPGFDQLAGISHAASFALVDRSPHQYVSSLPSRGLFPNGPYLRFAAQNQPGLHGCAFAIYGFELPDADEPSTLELEWTEAPPAGNLHLAFSNWQTRRWDFITLSDASQLALEDLTQWTDPANDQRMFMALIISRGLPEPELQRLRLQQSAAPVAVLTVDTQLLPPGELFSFDASQSSDDNGIAALEWNLDADNEFSEAGQEAELSGQTMAQVSFTGSKNHRVEIRVTDLNGSIATAEVTVSIYTDQIPQAKLKVNPASTLVGVPILLDASGTQGADSLYQLSWDLDDDYLFAEDGIEAGLTNQFVPELTFDAPGQYVVRIFAANYFGSGSYAEQLITVTEP